MSLAALRRSSRTVAFWLLLFSVWGLPHRTEGNDSCPPAGLEQHDESKHVFSSATRSDGAEHCAVCHWLRTIKHEFADSAAVDAGCDRASRPAYAATHQWRDGARRPVAARAPPSFLN
jgi:hypothetical protein